MRSSIHCVGKYQTTFLGKLIKLINTLHAYIKLKAIKAEGNVKMRLKLLGSK